MSWLSEQPVVREFLVMEATPMSKNVAQKLIESHLVEGRMQAGEEIGLKIDQTLTQDATGTLVMLELEAMGLRRVKTELSAQYVDRKSTRLNSRHRQI